MLLPVVPPFQSSTLTNSPTFFLFSHSFPTYSSSSPPFSAVARVSRRSPSRMLEVAGIGGGVRLDSPVPLAGDVEEANDVVFEHCVTRTLPPALTLDEGLRKIKNAVEILKAAPPRSSTGFLRFQVLVPPSPKALGWFCCQQESSGVFPLMFLSKNTDNPTLKSLFVNGSRGVFGIGAAVSFAHSSFGKHSLIKRYVSTDSTHITAYGFMDMNVDNDLVSVNLEDGSFCFFIPEIELDETESVSILTVTLAWDDFSPSTFEEALHSLEVTLDQVICHSWSTGDALNHKCIRGALGKLNLVDNRAISRV